MKLIRPPGTELRRVLAIYIMCLCDRVLWPTYAKIGQRDHRGLVECTCLFWSSYTF